MPIRINRRCFAGSIEFGDLFRREFPTDGTKVGAKLIFIARTDDQRGNRRALQQPVERDLRNGLAGFLGDLVNRIHHRVEILVGNLGADVGVQLGLQT